MPRFSPLVSCCLVALAVHCASASDDSQLGWLDESDPYYVSRDFPRLITPQWVGEEGVEAVVVLAIDDMRGHEKWEDYLRPILERLKQIDGRAPVSIMTCQIDPAHPHLQQWLSEGLSLETHTLDHPCPLLGQSDFAKARGTYERCVDLLHSVPNSAPVAFRMPCCDSLNTPSPRFYAEIFNRTTPAGNFLAIDSSVFNVFTSNDPELPRETVQDEKGQERFAKYVPRDRSFVNTIDNYPYPYVIGRLCWEFPCMVPSDWEAQHLQQPNNPLTVADMQAALDATLVKQGVFNLVFHPHGWIRSDQVISLIDHAVARHGTKVKFLTFREALERLNRHLLGGETLRAADGRDNGVRLLDLNRDGYQDVVIGNERRRETRLWSPETKRWEVSDLPTRLVRAGHESGQASAGAHFGRAKSGEAWLLVHNQDQAGAWRFTGGRWIADETLLEGLEIEGQPVLTAADGVDAGVRFRDLDGDGASECLAGSPRLQAVFIRDDENRRWHRAPFSLPAGTAIADDEGRDAGLRFVDVDEDGRDDVIFSNLDRYSLHLFRSMEEGWSRQVVAAQRQPGGEPPAVTIPPIVMAGANAGAWFHSRHMWVQNETTDRLKDLVDRRSFAELLSDVEPLPRSPRAALGSFVPRPGFKVELVAAEPLVMDPVAFAWGPDGKLWVVEMADYPLGIDGRGKHGGRVRYLEDTDGDGKYDASRLFLDELGFPTGVMPWRNGVLITCAPEIFFAADTDGDGRADLRRTLFSGFGEGNQQHRVNGLRWGLDNWIYCANGDSGGEIESTLTGEKVEIGGRDLRLRPDEGLIEPQTGLTQFGRERDDWGNWFGCNNSNPMFHFVLADHYLRRNPHLAPPEPRVQVSVAPGAAPVFPVSRTLPRFNDLNAANRFTSASSAIVYRDDFFGPHFRDNSFVCEPVHNLVHREIVSPEGVTFSSRRAADERDSEFLASTDPWFRPVMVRAGPDGALWIADMYRRVIEHPEWIPLDWQERLDLRAGHDKGRIWRVYPVGKRPRELPRLDRLDTTTLVSLLDSPSGTLRDMVQQLLVERGDRAAVEPLEQLAADRHRQPLCRLHALCTLDGLGALQPSVLLAALSDPHPGVQRHAVRLTEPLLDDSPEMAARVAELAEDAAAGESDAQLRLQLASTLGEWHSPHAGRPLARLARSAVSDRFLKAALLSSVHKQNLAETVNAILESTAAGDQPPLLDDLVALAVAMDNQAALICGLKAISRPRGGGYAAWQFAALAAMLDALDRRQVSWSQFRRRADKLLGDEMRQAEALFEAAAAAARDGLREPSERLLALGLLGRGPHRREADVAVLESLLVPQTSAEVQAAAVDALARLDDERVPAALLAGWQSYGPELRSRVVDALLAREAWALALLDEMAAGRLQPGELDAARRQRLLEHSHETIRRLASGLLSSGASADRQQVVDEYQSALEIEGEPARGALVFKRACSTCHRLHDAGYAIGPDLSALTDRSRESLLVALFDPNRAVESKYLSYTAITTAGITHTGMLAAETGNSITLVAAEGKQVSLLRSELEELAGSSKSLMPEGMEKDLAPQDVADLAAYLGGIRPPAKAFEGNRPAVVHPEGLRGEFWLLASQAEIYGTTLVFEERYGNLGYWGSPDDHALWSLEVQQAGRYDVWLDYACSDETAGNSWVVEVAGQRLTGRVEPTGNWDTYRQSAIGQVELPAGQAQLVVRPGGPLDGYLMDLKAVRLRPANP